MRSGAMRRLSFRSEIPNTALVKLALNEAPLGGLLKGGNGQTVNTG